MNSITTNLIKTIVFSIFILLFVNETSAQTTYKVVCDKTDNRIKVVESENRSANYVPIKGGFPFRQIAEQWITDNYTTTICNPKDISNQIKTKQNTTTQTNNNKHNVPSSTPPPTQPLQPQGGSTSAIKDRNSSLYIFAKFSNLGEAFLLKENMMPGFEAGFEQLFGKQIYFGTGVSGNFYFSDMDGWNDIDLETIYFFRFPAFVGYRTQKRNFVSMFEVGLAFNTSLGGTELNLESFGQTSEDYSANFISRIKVGLPGIMFEVGYDAWLSDVFVNNSYKMSAITMGLRFSF